MILRRIFLFFLCTITFYSCANYNVSKKKHQKEKHYFSSSGFALIYEDHFFSQKIVNKKLNNNEIRVMHNFLKTNTPVKIINPENLKFVDTKVYKKADYPKIFNAVISKEIASMLELDLDNPYIEILEVKKNKIFIAKKTNTFEEEKNVAEKAPVDEIKMDVLSESETNNSKKVAKRSSFIIVINDFYYEDSANNLKDELIKKTKMNNISVKKINNNKYRLLAGPFKNFNALKTSYISLNNLGFENLNIYKN